MPSPASQRATRSRQPEWKSRWQVQRFARRRTRAHAVRVTVPVSSSAQLIRQGSPNFNGTCTISVRRSCHGSDSESSHRHCTTPRPAPGPARTSLYLLRFRRDHSTMMRNRRLSNKAILQWQSLCIQVPASLKSAGLPARRLVKTRPVNPATVTASLKDSIIPSSMSFLSGLRADRLAS